MSKLRIKSAFFAVFNGIGYNSCPCNLHFDDGCMGFPEHAGRSIFYRDFKNNIETNYKALGINGDDITIDQLLSILQSNPVISGVIRGEDRSFTVIDKDTGRDCLFLR